MKSKFVKIATVATFLVGSVEAATVIISPTFSGGIFVRLDDVQTDQHYVSIGAWNGTSYTAFSWPTRDTGSISGSFTNTTNNGFDRQPIHVWVGLSNTLSLDAKDPTGSWVLLRSSTAILFPNDSIPTALTVAMSGTSDTSVVAYGASFVDFALQQPSNKIYISFAIPEPSTGLLVALSALGFLRRRI